MMKNTQKHRRRFLDLGSKRTSATIFIFLMLTLTQISMVSAGFFEYDNIKSFDNKIGNYGKIEIRNSVFGLEWFQLDKITEITLLENTEVCLNNNCEAVKEIIMFEDGKLIDAVRFIDLDTRKEVSIKNYQIKYTVNGKLVDYNYEEVDGNSEGIIYEVKLVGKLNPFQNVDWQIKANGIWIEEWAEWTSSLNFGLISYYNFDEGTGTLLEDITLNENDGTLTNMVEGDWKSGASCILGGCLDFDGVDAFVNISDDDSLDFTEFTFNFWMNMDSLPDGGRGEGIIDKIVGADDWTPYDITIIFDGNLRVLAENETGLVYFNVSDFSSFLNDWTMITFRLNSTHGEFFFNGTSIAESDVTDPPLPNTNDLILGLGLQDNFDGTMDELGIWDRSLTDSEIAQLYNDGAGITANVAQIILKSPKNNTLTINSTLNFNCSSQIFNISNSLLNLSLLINDEINFTVFNTSANQLNLDLETEVTLSRGDYNWSCIDGDTSEATTSSIHRFFSNYVLFNSETFNSTTFETSIESFSVDVSSDNGAEVTAELFYNNVNHGTATKVGNNTDMIFTQQVIIPLVSGIENKSIQWEIDFGDSLKQNTTLNSQIVNPITFGICNTTLNIPYAIFNFKNETITQEELNATIASIWNYWIGDGSITNSLSFSNATENTNYSFCFDPSDRALNVNYTINYNNAESQQRTTIATALFTNITSTITLYLLPSSIGLFSPFQTVNSVGDALEGVLAVITRTLSGSPITVTTSTTDSSGFLTIFLNPDITYSAVFSKINFPDNSFSFVPTSTTRTVTMGGGAGTINSLGNGTLIAQNTSYTILPSNSSLNNNTDYTFSFAVSSSQSITLISMNITNSTGYQLLFQSNAGAGIVSSILNTGNNTQLIGTYILKTSSETLSFTNIWIIGSEFPGDYSIFTQLTLFMDYNFTDFIRLLITLSIIIAVLIFMTAGEITDTSESKIAVATLLIWAFSVVGWMNTGIIADTEINPLGQFSNQYGIAILSTGISIYFIFRRIFIRRI